MTINYYGELFEGAKITPQITKAADETRKVAIKTLRQNTPVDTGRLKAGWKVVKEGHGFRITNETPYAVFVNMGTRNMAPRRMLEKSLPTIEATFKKALAKEIGKKLATKIIGGSGGVSDVGYESLTNSEGTKYSFGFRS